MTALTIIAATALGLALVIAPNVIGGKGRRS